MPDSLIKTSFLTPELTPAWDDFVRSHPGASLYHLSAWKEVIEETYGHRTYYLLATDPAQGRPTAGVLGILPLVHLKHILFGNALVSMPYFDAGGVLALSEKAERALMEEAVKLARRIGAHAIELRHERPLVWLEEAKSFRAGNGNGKAGSARPANGTGETDEIAHTVRSHKVRMVLPLPASSDALMASFKSKLRSQIRKPAKEGLTAKLGGAELLDDFYRVFVVNMRDLGSPVHSKRFIERTLDAFPESAKIAVVYGDAKPMACGLVIGFRDTLANPWASALRTCARLNPNMLLYWTMLAYGCDSGFKRFDFGRSSPDEGTYKFKGQWGTRAEPLHWHSLSLNGRPPETHAADKDSFDTAVRCWQKIPVPLTRVLGPMIRKHISL